VADPALLAAYADAIYDVQTPSGVESLFVGPNESPLPPLAIITAHNPGPACQTPAENAWANAELRRLLEQRGHRFVDSLAHDVAGSHAEPGFAIFGIPLDEAVALAHLFRQAAILRWDGKEARVIPVP
jgi:hypothetical protein